ncbi:MULTISPECIES: response regulator [unclassified Microbacterium]|uniref:response regulator n=1 Tax=Microbacterium TaxID=33882 RepID=UPI003BA0D260
MAIARLHGGPLDGQVLPLDSPDLEQLIVPYSETQVVYHRSGAAQHTGEGDGPTEVAFLFVEEEDSLVQDGQDDEDEGGSR